MDYTQIFIRQNERFVLSVRSIELRSNSYGQSCSSWILFFLFSNTQHTGTSCLNGLSTSFHDGSHHQGERGYEDGEETDVQFDAYRDKLEPIFVNICRICPHQVTSYVVVRETEMLAWHQSRGSQSVGMWIIRII